METVKSGFMRWKTACRWDKGGSRDAGLDLSGTGFGTDEATTNVLLSLVTPKGQIFVLTFPVGFPAGTARCTAAPGDGQHGLSSFTVAVNGKLTDATDVTKVLDLVAVEYKSLAPTLPNDPTPDEEEEDGDGGIDPNANEVFYYDGGSDESPDAFLKQTSVAFDASQRGQLSTESARILTKEFNLVKREEAGGKLCFRVLSETENDISKWAIEIHDLGGCKLTDELKARAVPGILLQFCFPVSYPNSPPLVRIVGPRLKYLSGNVTFSGVVCLTELSTAGWRPTFGVTDIVNLVIESLKDNNARLDIRTRTGYGEEEAAATAMQRQKSMSEYNKPFRHLQAQKLFAFRDERKNTGNRVDLPSTVFENIVHDLNNNIPHVLVFLLETPQFRTFVGVGGFGAREGIVHLPHYMMENMIIEDGSPVSLRLVKLPILTFVKFKPLEFELVEILEESRLAGTFGTSACPLVRAIGTNFVPFTTGDTIQVIVNEKPYNLFIMKTLPAVTGIIPQDGEYHDLKIEFCTAVDMDEASVKQDAAPVVAPPVVAASSAPAVVVDVETKMCSLCGKEIPVMSITLHQNRCKGEGADIEIARRMEAEMMEEEARETREAEEALRIADAQRRHEADVEKQLREAREAEAAARAERERMQKEIAKREYDKSGRGVDTRAPCRFFWGGGTCRDGPSCKFSHGSSDGGGGGTTPATTGGQRSRGGSGKPCMFFMAGSCRNGAGCTDDHYVGR